VCAVTDDIAEAVHSTELSFICVGTPSSPNGSQDLSAVRRVSEQIGAGGIEGQEGLPHRGDALDDPTRQHGLGRARRARVGERQRANVDFGLGFQPEFPAGGSSIKDYDNPPFTAIAPTTRVRPNAVRQVFGHLRASSS